MPPGRLVLTLALAVAVLYNAAETRAQTAQAFFEGKTIRWIIPYRPGGGFDEYSRLIAPYFKTCSGASVDLVNMPGAGSLKGTVEVYRAPSNGLHLGLLNGGAMVVYDILGKNEGLAPTDGFSFIGRVASEETVLLAATGSGLDSIDDMRTAEEPFVIGATSGGSSYADALIPAEIFGFNQKLVSGFDSSSQIRLALLRGDVKAQWASYSTQLKAIRDGIGTPLLRTGQGVAEGMEGVTSVHDLRADLTPENRALLDAWVAIADTGRLLMAPPDVPEDRRAFLEDALRCALENPELQAKSAAAERAVSFLGGAQARDLVMNAVGADPATRARLRAAMEGR